MKKRTTKKEAWCNRMIILTVSLFIIWLSFQFFSAAFDLASNRDAIKYLNQYANWALTDHQLYDQYEENIENISRSSDIGQWMVESGSTYTGQIVRFAVLAGFVVVDFFAIYLIASLIKMIILDCLHHLFGGKLAQSKMDFRISIKEISRQRRKAKFKRNSKHLTNNRRAS